MDHDPEELSDDRIWVDGCFDFSHHGHAGAMLQARRLGKSLHVGIHSDEAILENKGPTVMNLDERCTSANACRWSTVIVPNAPYVTTLPFISQYGCRYVVHGDDITSDSGGEDCYRFVKQAGRFKVVKRTPGISTTDLVGRMLLCTKEHFIHDLEDVLGGKEGNGSAEELQQHGQTMRQRIRDYATDETGHEPLVQVMTWNSTLERMIRGQAPRPGQRVIYVDGGFDLFTPGHIEFMRKVVESEERSERENGWYDEARTKQRVEESGSDYSPVFLIAGIHNDHVINQWKGVNYPIMNIFERGLCVLQCKYVSAVVFGAPFSPDEKYLHSFDHKIEAVYHGPTQPTSTGLDPYANAKRLGLYREIGPHKYAHINASEIVGRIMQSRSLYEERQRKKGVKGIDEAAVQRREQEQRDQETRKA